MLIQKSFKHPAHLANYYRAIIKQALRESRIAEKPKLVVPSLNKELSYYFIFELCPRESENILLYGLTCFDAEGIILFDAKGTYPVSLWRYRRQGLSRSALTFEGIVKSTFRRKNVPLTSEESFFEVENGVYQCNICWDNYIRLLNN